MKILSGIIKVGNLFLKNHYDKFSVINAVGVSTFC